MFWYQLVNYGFNSGSDVTSKPVFPRFSLGLLRYGMYWFRIGTKLGASDFSMATSCSPQIESASPAGCVSVSHIEFHSVFCTSMTSVSLQVLDMENTQPPDFITKLGKIAGVLQLRVAHLKLNQPHLQAVYQSHIEAISELQKPSLSKRG